MSEHAHLHTRGPAIARALRTVYTGHTLFMHELAPAAVSENHQLGHDFIEWRTTLSALESDDVVSDIEMEVNAIF